MKIIFVFIVAFSINNCHSQLRVKIVGNSLIGKIAAKINGSDNYAVTIGRTIFVSCSKEQFLSDPSWITHELTHVRQYERLGMIGFLQRYFVYYILYGYRQNPLEKEAFASELK